MMNSQQELNGGLSPWGVPVSFTVLLPLTISSVSVSPDLKPTVTGTGGLNGATLEIWRTGGAGGVLMSKVLNATGNWSVTASAAWTPGRYSVTSRLKSGGHYSEWSGDKAFTIQPPRPVISPPPNPAAVKQPLMITNVASGAVILQMLTEANVAVAGNFSGSGDRRTFTPTADWSWGTSRVKVVQTVGGVASEASELVTVTLKPAPPVINNIFFGNDLRPSISGNAGLYGATLQIWRTDETGGIQISKVLTGNGDWLVSASAEWTPGRYSIKSRQMKEGQFSEWSANKEFVVSRMKLAISSVTVSVGNKPTVNGTGGLRTGIIEISRSDSSIVEMSTFLLVDGDWSVTAPIAWIPGNYSICSRMKLGAEYSDYSATYEFLVDPKKLILTPPKKPAAAKQKLYVSNLPLIVTLKMLTEGDATVDGQFVRIGATSVFTPNEDWAPGNTRIKVVPTGNVVDVLPSDWVTVVIRPSQPVIAAPPKPAATRQQLTVTGVYSGAVSLQMFNAEDEPVDGSFSNSGETRTFSPNVDWVPGVTRVKVVQTFDGVASAPSNLVSVAVKPLKPVIAPPPVPAEVREPLSVSNVAVGTVGLKAYDESNRVLPGVATGRGSLRTFTPQIWPWGNIRIKIVQTVGDVASDPSELTTLMVKPPKPFIEPPPSPATAKEPLVVTNVVSDILQMLSEEDAPIAGDFTGSGATRIFTPTHDWSSGDNWVKVLQRAGDVASDPSEPVRITVVEKPPKPSIEPPASPVSTRETLTITNVASSLVTLQMLTGENVPVAGDFSGSGTTRTFTPLADWAEGDNTVRVVQTVDGIDSEPSDDCTFTVETGEKPEAPQFELPLAGSKTSTRPVIRVLGLPRARLTVRLEGSDTLHSGDADDDGFLQFTAQAPLIPGPNPLQVNQKSGGPTSEWSEPHWFTVKELPQTPHIEAPTPGSQVQRKPTIRGRGETRGEIGLRHTNDPDNLIDQFSGRTGWWWTAKEAWDIGTYTIQAQQTDEGDSSEWTKDPVTFEVVDALYGIGDASPVLVSPVVGSGQNVELRVRVLVGDTGEPAEGVQVQWRLEGGPEDLATTTTDRQGWAVYKYTPDAAGKVAVLADITRDNAGIVMTQRYEVTALVQDDWTQEAGVYLDGERVERNERRIVLLRGQSYELELRVKPGSRLIGSWVALNDLWGAEDRGLAFVPELGKRRMIDEAQSVHWSISAESVQSGLFGLSLVSPGLTDWQFSGYVESGDLAEQLEVEFDTFAQVFGGDTAYPCLGATHTLTLRPKPGSFLTRSDVILELSLETEGLDVTLSPNTPQTLVPEGVIWTLNCTDSKQGGELSLWLKVPGRDFYSMPLSMSLGHNKVKVTETSGPQQAPSPADFWNYGIRATSVFTGQPAAGVPVSVLVTGAEPAQRATAHNGWIHVTYSDGQSASLIIRNRYDGSIA